MPLTPTPRSWSHVHSGPRPGTPPPRPASSGAAHSCPQRQRDSRGLGARRSQRPRRGHDACTRCSAPPTTALPHLRSSFFIRMSHSLMVSSREALSSQLPLLFQANRLTPWLCALMVKLRLASRGSHSRIWITGSHQRSSCALHLIVLAARGNQGVLRMPNSCLDLGAEPCVGLSRAMRGANL